MAKTKKQSSGRAQSSGASKSGWANGRFYDGGISGVIGILGQPRTGKSYLAALLIRQCGRVAIYDPCKQYGDSPSGTRVRGFAVVTQPGELIAFLRRRGGGNFRVLYQPATGDAEHFDYFVKVIYAAGNCVMLCDEIWLSMTASWMPPSLRAATLTGRHRGITLIYTAQVPARVSYDLRSITTNWKLFRMTLERNLLAVRDFVSSEILAKLRTLPDRVYCEIDDQGNYRVKN